MIKPSSTFVARITTKPSGKAQDRKKRVKAFVVDN